MATSETVKMEIGYEDDGTIIFVEIDKENIQLARKALAYLYKQEQEEKKKMRALASTCRNCKFSQPRNRYDNTLTCGKRIKEVDLEKEIIRYQREDMDRDTTVGDVARHFYKLGLKAREENK